MNERKPPCDDDEALSVEEHGERFETGKPVTVRFVRNTRPAPKLRPYEEDRYQQRIDPAGRYMVHNPDPGRLPPDWESGNARFERPLVIALNTDPRNPIYDQNSWKVRLSRRFGGKTGKALSLAIRRAGYDGVVTVTLDGKCRPIDTREIVDLTMFPSPPPRKQRGSSNPDPLRARVERAIGKKR
jgi:hypothetical protein